MAKRKKLIDPVQPIRPDLKARFLALITTKEVSNKKVAGFKTINTNQLWRWDTLEDVKQ